MRKFERLWRRLLPIRAYGAAAYLYLSLPDVRRCGRAIRKPPRSSNCGCARHARKGSLRVALALGAVPRISTNLKRAVLVAEDSGFWQHEGIDFEQMKESIEVNIERLEFARGARSRSNSPRTCICRHRRIRSGRSARS